VELGREVLDGPVMLFSWCVAHTVEGGLVGYRWISKWI
jgi:hypothetical protein